MEKEEEERSVITLLVRKMIESLVDQYGGDNHHQMLCMVVTKLPDEWCKKGLTKGAIDAEKDERIMNDSRACHYQMHGQRIVGPKY